MYWQSIKSRSLSQQRNELLARFPDSRIGFESPSGFRWYCELQPNEDSPFYTIRIDWFPAKMSYPEVYVCKPKTLRLHSGAKKLPHVWDNKKQKICLHVRFEWDKSKSIASYYVPWARDWLYYYEVWYVTGEWLGGGHEEQ